MSAESNNPPQQRPLSDIREAITQLDADLLKLFAKRRDLSLSVALSKESTQ